MSYLFNLVLLCVHFVFFWTKIGWFSFILKLFGIYICNVDYLLIVDAFERIWFKNIKSLWNIKCSPAISDIFVACYSCYIFGHFLFPDDITINYLCHNCLPQCSVHHRNMTFLFILLWFRFVFFILGQTYDACKISVLHII